MLAVMITALVIAGLIVFLQAPQFLSIATAVPASAYAADRARVFNENVDGLYSNLGSPEDLDMMLGTARLDTLYLAITDQFNLYDHYKIPADEEAPRLKAARKLKKNSSIIKGDFGELRVKVWDTDKQLAAQLANALLEKLQAIHRDLQSDAGQGNNFNCCRQFALPGQNSGFGGSGGTSPGSDSRSQYRSGQMKYPLQTGGIINNSRSILFILPTCLSLVGRNGVC